MDYNPGFDHCDMEWNLVILWGAYLQKLDVVLSDSSNSFVAFLETLRHHNFVLRLSDLYYVMLLSSSRKKIISLPILANVSPQKIIYNSSVASLFWVDFNTDTLLLDFLKTKPLIKFEFFFIALSSQFKRVIKESVSFCFPISETSFSRSK